ncbi:exopolysaccharide biosynthesis protein [Roseivivax halodurans]|nr:exopolysaccharide biosynthesis protein [Roseivivax halodurans]
MPYPVSAEPGEPRFSDLLRSLGEGTTTERMSVGALIAGLGRRGHGALLIVLGAPNVLPLPVPGLSLLAGLPLLFLTLQIAAGRPTPWVPDWLARRTIGAAEFRRAALAIATRLARLERIVRPRWPALTTGWPRRALGLFSLLLAVTLFLPLPLGNALPGLSLALIGLALIERDAVVAACGIAIGLVGLAVMSAASAAIVSATVLLVAELLS